MSAGMQAVDRMWVASIPLDAVMIELRETRFCPCGCGRKTKAPGEAVARPRLVVQGRLF